MNLHRCCVSFPYVERSVGVEGGGLRCSPFKNTTLELCLGSGGAGPCWMEDLFPGVSSAAVRSLYFSSQPLAERRDGHIALLVAKVVASCS